MSIRSALTVDILTNLLMITCNSIPERLSTRVAGQQATAVPLPDVVLQARAGHVVLPAEGALVRTRRRLALGTIHVYIRIHALSFKGDNIKILGLRQGQLISNSEPGGTFPSWPSPGYTCRCHKHCCTWKD